MNFKVKLKNFKGGQATMHWVVCVVIAFIVLSIVPHKI